MSLTVYLRDPKPTWRDCPYCSGAGHVRNDDELYARNITHNLAVMAAAADLYSPIWRPEEMDPPVTTAQQLIPFLTDGLAKLKADPDLYRRLDDPKGWGLYQNFVPFVEALLEACSAHPEARIEASR